jgi:hypothetical protein
MAGMSGFDRRREGFEGKFALDEETKFKVQARRDKLLGLWAAGQMGLAGEAAEAFAREMIKADLAEPGDADLLRAVKQAFAGKGVAITDQQIEERLRHYQDEARRQIAAEG